MKKLCESISNLSQTYFFEPDVFTFTQNNWELGNKLWDVKDDTEASFKLLATSGLNVSVLSAFEKELLNVKKLVENDL